MVSMRKKRSGRSFDGCVSCSRSRQRHIFLATVWVVVLWRNWHTMPQHTPTLRTTPVDTIEAWRRETDQHGDVALSTNHDHDRKEKPQHKTPSYLAHPKEAIATAKRGHDDVLDHKMPLHEHRVEHISQTVNPQNNQTALNEVPTDSWFCPKDTYSTQAWITTRKNLTYGPLGGGARAEYDYPNQDDRHWYCDKFPQDVRPWIAPTRYAKDDLVVGIYTGESIVHSRGMAVHDTWLSDLPNGVLYTPTTLTHVPTVGLEQYHIKPDFENQQAAHWAQLYGLKDMYERFPNKSWYFIVGCDTYLNVDHALTMLETYDATKPFWITKSRYPNTPMPDAVNNTALYPNYRGDGYTWSSGAWGWFLSRPVVEAYVKALDDFLETYDTLKVFCYCPDLVTGALLSLLGFDITAMESKWADTYDHRAPDGETSAAPTTLDWSLSHYVKPRRMLALHERTLHETIDRMRAGRMDMDAWGRAFVERHQRVRRRKVEQLKHHHVYTNMAAYETLPREPHAMVTLHIDMLREVQPTMSIAANRNVTTHNHYDINITIQK